MITPGRDAVAFSLPLRHRFRGITLREGLLVRGAAGWAEWSPFAEYNRPEIDAWWRATWEAAHLGFPDPVRDRVPVNVTVPAVDPASAHRIVAESGCGTAKVKVAEPGQDPADDCDRLEAVRDALGADGRLRVDANGAWDVDTAERRLTELARFDLEYVEQPCASVPRPGRPCAAGWPGVASTCRSPPTRASVARATPNAWWPSMPPTSPCSRCSRSAGCGRCLALAERLGLPVVVSSALESSVGLAAGVALAAALPELPYACGLNTATMFTTDVTVDPLVAQNGEIAVRPVVVDLLGGWQAGEAATAAWLARRDAIPDR